MKNHTILFFLLSGLFLNAQNQSIFEVEINNDGIVLPRVGKADKMMMNPKEGQLFYNPDDKVVMFFNGADWVSLEGQVMATDVDGNVYPTIKIGGIEWMTRDYVATKLNDGTPLTMGGSGSIIDPKKDTKSGGGVPTMWYYDNDPATYGPSYGALYNFCAVATGNLCPIGWRVPTSTDWNNLITAAGGLQVAGGNMKEVGLTHWNAPNLGATNSTGFTARGGGYYLNGNFSDIKESVRYWQSNGSNSVNGLYYGILAADQTIFPEAFPLATSGISVRCVR